MKDRIITKLTALVLLLAIAGGSAFAQQKKLGFQGRPSNLHERNLANMIDFDLIKNDLGSRDVTVQIGDIAFKGKLSSAGLSLPQERVDEIADQVFKDMKLSSGKMARIEEDLAGVDLGPDVNWITLTEDLCSLVGIAFPPVGMAGDVVSVANGDESAAQGFFNVGCAVLITAATASAVVVGGATAPVLGPAVFAVGTIANYATNASTLMEKLPSAYHGIKGLSDYFVDFLDGNPTARRCMESAIIHYDYYRRVNALIAQETMKKDAGNWKLDLDDYKSLGKTLFEVNIGQSVHLTMHLERQDVFGPDAKSNWQGSYKGKLHLRITHNLTNFDKQFKDKVIGSLPFSRLGYIDFPDDASGDASKLVKDLSGDDFTIELRSADGTISGEAKRTFSLNGLEDKSFFNCKKHIVGKANVGTWVEGKFQFAYFRGNALMDLDLLGSLVDNKCSAALKVIDQKDAWNVNTWFVHMSGKDEIAPVNTTGTAVFVDGTVFSDLKKLKFISVSPRKVNL